MALEAVLFDDGKGVRDRLVRATQGPADKGGDYRAESQQERDAAPVSPSG